LNEEANVPNDNPKADVDISVTDELAAADTAVISDGLRAYYVSQAGYYDFRPLAVFVREPQTGKVTGGLHGAARPHTLLHGEKSSNCRLAPRPLREGDERGASRSNAKWQLWGIKSRSRCEG
jgi:hypothetical protein